MKTWFEENAESGRTYKLAISILLGSLFLVISLVFLAESSYASTPTILTVSPSEAPNNFDTTVVITGTDFDVVISGTLVLTAPVVRLGDTVLSLEGLVTSRTLTATVPWGLDAGVYPISVQNADGTTATLTSAFTVTAALGVWTTGGPYGGSVKHIEMDKDVTSTLYANLDMVGLFKSENNGESWYNVFPGYVTQFTLKPDDPQTIYLSGDVAAGQSRLLRSPNGGQDWEEIWGGRPWALGVSSGDPDILYFGSGSAITRSLDSGDTWEWAGNGIPNDAWVSVLAVHPVTPNIAYAGISSGQVYKTIDGGANWAATSADFGETLWSSLVIDPHYPELS